MGKARPLAGKQSEQQIGMSQIGMSQIANPVAFAELVDELAALAFPIAGNGVEIPYDDHLVGDPGHTEDHNRIVKALALIINEVVDARVSSTQIHTSLADRLDGFVTAFHSSVEPIANHVGDVWVVPAVVTPRAMYDENGVEIRFFYPVEDQSEVQEER